MNAPGTPGPWHIFASGFAADHNQVEINDVDGLTVAYAVKFVTAHQEVSAANANLIAAAPDLFASVEALLHGIDVLQLPAETACARQAIAKARGDA